MPPQLLQLHQSKDSVVDAGLRFTISFRSLLLFDVQLPIFCFGPFIRGPTLAFFTSFSLWAALGFVQRTSLSKSRQRNKSSAAPTRKDQWRCVVFVMTVVFDSGLSPTWDQQQHGYTNCQSFPLTFVLASIIQVRYRYCQRDPIRLSQVWLHYTIRLQEQAHEQLRVLKVTTAWAHPWDAKQWIPSFSRRHAGSVYTVSITIPVYKSRQNLQGNT